MPYERPWGRGTTREVIKAELCQPRGELSLRNLRRNASPHPDRRTLDDLVIGSVRRSDHDNRRIRSRFSNRPRFSRWGRNVEHDDVRGQFTDPTRGVTTRRNSTADCEAGIRREYPDKALSVERNITNDHDAYRRELTRASCCRPRVAHAAIRSSPHRPPPDTYEPLGPMRRIRPGCKELELKTALCCPSAMKTILGCPSVSIASAYAGIKWVGDACSEGSSLKRPRSQRRGSADQSLRGSFGPRPRLGRRSRARRAARPSSCRRWSARSTPS
jgi:hypothetical protein